MEFVIQGPDDAEEISKFVHDMWVETYAPIIIGGRKRAEEIFYDWVGPDKICEDMAAGHFFAYVVDGGKKLGLISAGKEGDDLDVSKIYVLPEARHRHVGSAAMNYMLDYGRRNGCSRAFLEVNPLNSSAIEFYRRMGFSIDSLKPHDVGYTLIMAIDL